jgi:hypothetical protein
LPEKHRADLMELHGFYTADGRSADGLPGLISQRRRADRAKLGGGNGSDPRAFEFRSTSRAPRASMVAAK